MATEQGTNMVISVGDTLPDAEFLRIGESGPEAFPSSEVVGEGKTVIFGLPGAFTGTCDKMHVPSFIRVMDQLAEKGVKSVCCMSVNDPFVMKAWGLSTGAEAAGIHMVADPMSDFTKALGLEFSAPPAGLLNRSKRFSMVIEGGKVTHLNLETEPGMCEIAAGETLLAQL